MYSTDQLEKIKEYAGLLLSPDQIALMLEVELDVLKSQIRKINTEAYLAYHKGKLEILVEIRKQEINLAKLGSPMAVDLVDKYILEQKLGEQ